MTSLEPVEFTKVVNDGCRRIEIFFFCKQASLDEDVDLEIPLKIGFIEGNNVVRSIEGNSKISDTLVSSWTLESIS